MGWVGRGGLRGRFVVVVLAGGVSLKPLGTRIVGWGGGAGVAVSRTGGAVAWAWPSCGDPRSCNPYLDRAKPPASAGANALHRERLFRETDPRPVGSPKPSFGSASERPGRTDQRVRRTEPRMQKALHDQTREGVVAAEAQETRLPLEVLCLDPNNPRFADLDVSRRVPEDRVHEATVQDTALGRMLDERFDVEQLKQSIFHAGFLEVDRLVVVPLPESDKYVVIEGNRRVASLRSLLLDEQAGEITLPDELREKMKSLPVLVIKGETQERDALARTIQGLRHTPGVKAWGPYQQAQFVALMLDQGEGILEIKSTLGLSTVRVNSLRRVYRALEQMKADPEFGEFARPHLFSNFEEALKPPRIREWVEWDDENGKIANDQHRTYLYQWLVGEEDEDGNRLPPKIIDAKDVRLLPRLLENPPALQRFIDEPGLSLRAAAQAVPTPEPTVDWRGALVSSLSTLNHIPAVDLFSAHESDLELLSNVKSLCETLIEQLVLARDGEPQDNNVAE